MRLRSLTAFVLLWALTPGLPEATQDLSHALFFGHTAHSTTGEEGHDDSDPEHSCTGAVHICACHASPHSLLARVPRNAVSDDTARLPQLEIPRPLMDTQRALEHVPRA